MSIAAHEVKKYTAFIVPPPLSIVGNKMNFKQIAFFAFRSLKLITIYYLDNDKGESIANLYLKYNYFWRYAFMQGYANQSVLDSPACTQSGIGKKNT